MAQAIFECNSVFTSSSSYFHGYFNGTEFCYTDREDGYLTYQELYDIITTSTPEITIGDNSNVLHAENRWFLGFRKESLEDFVPGIMIKTPSMPQGSSIYHHLQSLQKGKLTLKNVADSINGFTVALEIPYDIKRENGVASEWTSQTYSTESRSQEGSSLELIPVKRKITENYISITLEFEINCKMYRDTNGTYIGDLTDGIFRFSTLIYP